MTKDFNLWLKTKSLLNNGTQWDPYTSLEFNLAGLSYLENGKEYLGASCMPGIVCARHPVWLMITLRATPEGRWWRSRSTAKDWPRGSKAPASPGK